LGSFYNPTTQRRKNRTQKRKECFYKVKHLLDSTKFLFVKTIITLVCKNILQQNAFTLEFYLRKIK
ncbi:MAG: hypothetical protein CK427_11755, partial [Leptospira sp.]